MIIGFISYMGWKHGAGENVGQHFDFLVQFGPETAVNFNGHHGLAAPALPGQAQVTDIYSGVCHDFRDSRNGARRVAVEHNQGWCCQVMDTSMR